MKPKIYIVEDDPLIAETIKTILECEGYSTLGIAANAKDALFELSDLKPDLILLDITIEGSIDGVTLAEKIDQLYKIPYLFLTSLSDPETINRVKQTNAKGYISKPFNEGALISNIELALPRKQNIGENLALTEENEPFYIKHKGELIKVKLQEIQYLEAFDNYCYVITEEKYIVSNTLKAVAERINNSKFIRVHRSFVVNLEHITSISESTIFIGNQKIPIGKSYKDNLMQNISLL